ncbi:uncharacterized protein LOC116655179 isoform X1 [Drosophila ananassae]|uniref:uncharacterized protein LOC116655179 isoform X1 n=2 Tax=Drosophila ananassae TaxID=7217 RepID=UPI0013A5EF39|nr:uncharacterized protein LOC116655179 isoform X1 [Drosophila ananassae]
MNEKWHIFKNLEPMEEASESIGSTLFHLKELVRSTCLSGHIRFYNKNFLLIPQISQNFRKVLKGINHWEMDRVHPILAGLSILILMDEEEVDVHRKLRCRFMERFLNFIDCIYPMSVHLLMERLLVELDYLGLGNDSNLLYLAVALAHSCVRGRPLAVCMLWELLARRLSGLEITMHRYREPSELADAIDLNPPQMPDGGEEKKKLLILLEAIDHLMHLLLEEDNDELVKTGYPEHFFQLERRDAEIMYIWCQELVGKIPSMESELNTKLTETLGNLIEIFGRIMTNPETTEIATTNTTTGDGTTTNNSTTSSGD